jgi:hypothetical protein
MPRLGRVAIPDQSLVGYLYLGIGCDSGSGDRVGCVQGSGPVGYIAPVGDMRYLNLKAYGEFANANRPAGWNLWRTLNLAPAATPPTLSSPK